MTEQMDNAAGPDAGPIGETPENSAVLLDAIDKIYSTALSPTEHDAFMAAWTRYLASNASDGVPEHDAPILDHFDRALSVVEKLHFSAQEASSPQDIADRHLGAAAIASEDGAIVATNTAWRGIHPDACEQLWALSANAGDQRELRNAVRALQTVVQTRTEFVRYQPPAQSEAGLVALRRLPVRSNAERPLILARSAGAVWSPTVGRLLQEHFELTGAELALLERLARGQSFDAIARDRGRSKDTLKVQSKSIYRKMGVAGREDAARAAMQLHFLWDGTPEPATSGRGGPGRTPEDTHLIIAPNGQRIAYSISGDPNGAPFLFLHGMALGHGMKRELCDALAEAGLKAIRIDRPGYGRSDPPREWRRGIEEWVDLFPCILDQLGLASVPLVSHTTGVLSACTAACAHPDRVTGILAVTGGVPVVNGEMPASFPVQIRLLARTAIFSPRALRFLVSATAAFYRGPNGQETIIRRSYDKVPPDREALADPETFALVNAGMLMSPDGGFDGFICDAQGMFNDWSQTAADVACPITYLMGELDPICPVDWARAFAQRYTHITVEVVPGAGQLLQHTHWRAFLAHVVELTSAHPARLKAR